MKNDIKIIQEAFKVDRYISSQTMTDLLMDDTISTYDMYGDLVDLYCRSDDTGKDAINKTLKILTRMTLPEIAQEIINMAKEAEED